MKERIIAIVILLVCWSIGTIGMLMNIDGLGGYKAARLIFVSIGGYGILSATVLNIWNAWDASRIQQERMNFDKIDNSFEYLKRWDSPSLKEARDLTREIKKEKSKLSDDTLMEKIQSDVNIERSVITTFNFWEEIYRSIEHGRVKSGILKDAFGEIFCDMYERFKPWRESMKKNKGNQKGMKALDSLNEKWRDSKA